MFRGWLWTTGKRQAYLTGVPNVIFLQSLMKSPVTPNAIPTGSIYHLRDRASAMLQPGRSVAVEACHRYENASTEKATAEFMICL